MAASIARAHTHTWQCGLDQKYTDGHAQIKPSPSATHTALAAAVAAVQQHQHTIHALSAVSLKQGPAVALAPTPAPLPMASRRPAHPNHMRAPSGVQRQQEERRRDETAAGHSLAPGAAPMHSRRGTPHTNTRASSLPGPAAAPCTADARAIIADAPLSQLSWQVRAWLQAHSSRQCAPHAHTHAITHTPSHHAHAVTHTVAQPAGLLACP